MSVSVCRCLCVGVSMCLWVWVFLCVSVRVRIVLFVWGAYLRWWRAAANQIPLCAAEGVVGGLVRLLRGSSDDCQSNVAAAIARLADSGAWCGRAFKLCGSALNGPALFIGCCAVYVCVHVHVGICG